MGETYYEILGVAEDASTAEIQRAYRETLKETHPDVSDSADASERTKRLIEAKETLTDESERRRYDRLGHEQYVSSDTGDSVSAGTASTDTTESNRTSRHSRTGGNQSRQTSSNGGGSRNRSRRRSRNRRNRSQRRTTTENVGSGAAWAQTSPRTGQSESVGGSDEREGRSRHFWSTDRAYAVERGVDALRFGGLFDNQRALVLLGTTFLVYPVLLYGALNPAFPLAVNLLIAACVVFVIAFLQSIPEVGMVVFGSWTFLLPPLMLLWLGFSIVSLPTILALTAVVFPFGLSALTRVAIRPVSAG